MLLFLKLILLLTILIIAVVDSVINPHGPTVAAEYTNCVNQLIEDNFDDAGLLIFAHTKEMSTTVSRIRAEVLKLVHYHNKYFVEILSPTDNETICWDDEDDAEGLLAGKELFEPIPIANYFVIVVDRYQDFTRVASKLIKSMNWNSRAKFIILLFSYSTNSKANIGLAEKILQCMFRTAYVLNAVVLVPEANNIRNVLVYGWRPLDPPHYCGYANETAKGRLFMETTCERGVLKRHNTLYKDSLPVNMKGCHVNIMALERQPFVSNNPRDPNIEKLLIKELIEEFGLETDFNLVNISRGEINHHGEWEGALKLLLEKNADLVLGAIFPDDEVHRDFECSSTYLADSYTWVVPRAQHAPAWLSLIVTFDKLVWYSTVAGFTLCVIFWKFFGAMSGESVYHRRLDHCFMNTLVSNLGWCAYARPVGSSLRVFFSFFSLYCILFVTSFSTKLIDVLTNPNFVDQISTIEEIIDSGLKLGGSEELQDLFNNSDPFDQIISEQWIFVEDVHKAMVDVVVHRNFSLLCSRMEIAYLAARIPQLSDSFGNLKYYALEQNVFTVSLEMVALRGFPHIEELSLMLGKFSSMGVNSGFRRRFKDMTERRRAELLDDLDDDKPDVASLSMNHLQGGFIALALGSVSGTLVLFIEIFINSNYYKEKVGKLKGRFNKKVEIKIQ